MQAINFDWEFICTEGRKYLRAGMVFKKYMQLNGSMKSWGGMVDRAL